VISKGFWAPEADRVCSDEVSGSFPWTDRKGSLRYIQMQSGLIGVACSAGEWRARSEPE